MRRQCRAYILAHDLGTTGNKANIFDEQGTLVASAFEGYETSYPQAGWAEQDPGDWWNAVCKSTRTLLAQPGLVASDIAVISFSAQMMACLPVTRDGAPLRRAIIWADQRATEQAERLSDLCGEERMYRLTGHRVSAAYTGPKMLWVRDHEPDIYARADVFLQAKDYVVFHLTGALATDYSDASGTNLFNLDRRAWDEDILKAVGIRRDLLPDALPSHQIVGQVSRAAAQEIGLLAGTPVTIGGGDGACATVGAGVVREGDAYNYIGSSSWMAVASPQPIYDPRRRIVNFCHLDPALVCPMGTTQTAGGAYTWLSTWLGDRHENPELYRDMDSWAAEIGPGAEGLLFLPYLMGERSPHWNPQARGAFIGLSMRHTRGHAARAVLEGVGFNLRMVLDALTEQGLRIDAMRLIGGGARSSLWRQILADIFGLNILRPQLLAEATSLGAAIAGGVGVGIWSDYGVAHDLAQASIAETPDPETNRAYEEIYGVFQEIYQALVPIYGRLAGLGSDRAIR